MHCSRMINSTVLKVVSFPNIKLSLNSKDQSVTDNTVGLSVTRYSSFKGMFFGKICSIIIESAADSRASTTATALIMLVLIMMMVVSSKLNHLYRTFER